MDLHINKDAQIAQGATADLYIWPTDDGQDDVVLKLYHVGHPMQQARREAVNAQAACAAGIPTPVVIGLRQMAGRTGVLFRRVPGPTMLEQLLSGASEPAQLAQMLAELHVALHETSILRAPVSLQHKRLLDALNRAALTDAERSEMQQNLVQLLQENVLEQALCHGDFHPGNIIMSPDGPMIIDWVDLSQGDPTADVARTLLLLEYSALPLGLTDEAVVQMMAVRRTFGAAYVARYAELAPLNNQRLQRWLR